MFKFSFKKPKKKEDTSDVEVGVVTEVNPEDLKAKFDTAVRDTLINSLTGSVSVELFKMVYGQEAYEQSAALSKDKEALGSDLTYVKYHYPKARYEYAAGRYVGFSVDMKDLLRYISSKIADEVIKGENQ